MFATYNVELGFDVLNLDAKIIGPEHEAVVVNSLSNENHSCFLAIG
jgi:hypothetical protein